jgi:hypothetical protein
MANFFTLQDGNLTDISTYGYSLTSAEIMNNTTGTMLLTSGNFYSASVNSDGSTLSAIALHLSARSVNPNGTLGLTLQRTSSAGTFLDSSSNNSSITTVGSAFQNTFSPFSPNGWSGYFNGTTDYLTVSSSQFAFGTGNFTIEFWIYPLAYGGSVVGAQIFGTTNGGTNGYSINLGQSKSTFRIVSNASGVWTDNITLSDGPDLNIWTHIAVVRNGNNLSIYKNGLSAVGLAGVSTFNFSESTAAIGRYFEGTNTRFLNGYISNIRVVNSALYTTTSFTPSASHLTNIANTALLTLQDNRFKDNSNNNYRLSTFGSISIKDTSPFTPVTINPSVHGGSAFFRNTYLTTTSQPSLSFGTGDFTVEAWVYPLSNLGQYEAICAGTESTGFSLQTQVGNDNKICITTTAAQILAGTIPLSTNQWNHVAATRSSGRLLLYINGLSSAQVNGNTTNFAPITFIAGGTGGGGVNILKNSYVSNFRVIKGTALYTTASFTPSTSPLTNISGTSLLLNTNNYGLKNTISETYPISSFTGFDGSNNLLTNHPQNWQILKLTNPLSVDRGDVINYTLNTSSPNQLSLVGAAAAADTTGVTRLSTVGTPLLTSFNPYPNFDDSYYLNGTTDWFNAPANPRFALDGNFTIECWINTSVFSLDTSNHRNIFGWGANATNNLRLMFAGNLTTDSPTQKLNIYAGTGTSFLLVGTINVADGNWHHVAISRYNNVLRLYVDGIQSGPSVNNTTNFNAGTTNILSIGAHNNSQVGRLSAAYINNFRIVNGTAVYTTSSFSPPTSPLTVIPNTVFLMKNGVRYDQALIANNYTSLLSSDSIHIGGALKGLSSEPRTITASTSSFQNIYIHNQGTLTFPSTSNVTLNINGSAGLQITSDGTLNIGTSSSVIPLSTTHTIILSNTQIDVHNGGNFNIYGFPETTTTSLVSTHPIGSRTFTTTNNVSGDWKVGDVLSFKPNLSARRSFDTLTLSSFVAPNVFTTTSNSLCTHTGSADQYAFIPDVYNLSRNIIIQGLNVTSRGTIRTIDAAKTSINYAQLSNFGINSSNKTGFIIGNNSNGSTTLSGIVINSDNNIIPLTGKSFQNITINNNIINRSNVVTLTSLSVNNVNISNNYILSSGGNGLNLSNLSGSINMSNNTTIGSLSYGTYIANNILTGTYGANNFNSGLQGTMISGTNTGTVVGGGLNSPREGVYVDASTNNLSALAFQNILASNNSSVGFKVSGNNLNYLTPVVLNINGLIANTNSDAGFEGYNITGNIGSLTVNNNLSGGVKTSIGNGFTTFDGLTSILSGIPLNILSGYNYSPLIIRNTLLSSNSSVGIRLDSSRFSKFSLENSTISANAPIQLNITRNLIEGSYLFNNTFLGSIIFIDLNKYQPNAIRATGFAFTDYNKIAGNHFTYLPTGTKASDTVLYDSSTSDLISERLTPISRTNKLCSGTKYVALNSGETTLVKVNILVSSSYNGNSPRLMLRRNAAAGIYSDTVLQAFTPNIGYDTFVQLIGTQTPAVIDNAVLEFYVDCDGTAGYICVDTWFAN